MADSQPGVDASALKACGALLAAEAARFASFGWMRGTSGNLSMVLSREPLRLAVTASGLDKGELTEADIVAVDADGDLVPVAAAGLPAAGLPAAGLPAVGRASDARPSAEAAVHARIAAVTGAGAVMHVHTVAAVAAGQRWPSGVELEGLEMLKGIGLPAEGPAVRVPVVPNSQDMVHLCGCIEQSRDPQVPAVIVAGHGLYAWGKDIRQARHHTEVVGWLLELALVAR
jgi:methylthioribulose-1-phosphate dehydratase